MIHRARRTNTTDRIRPLRALVALGRLIAEPTDTQQVFTVIESLNGRNPAQLVARLRSSASGRRLLETRPAIVDLLSDRAALEALPAGSVGRAYLEFLDREGISADGLIDASDAGQTAESSERDDDIGFLTRRLRDTHDLWHVLAGYQGDVFGETALLAFSAAQTSNKGVALMALAACLRANNRTVTAEVLRAFSAGRRAGWLPAVAFEDLLARPLDEVRRELGITPAGSYTRMRDDWTWEESPALAA